MLFAKGGGDPDDCGCSRSGGVCQDLTKMRVIGDGQLVLDNEDGVVRDVAADKVERVAADGVLGGLELKVYPERLGKMVGVLKQPGSEVVRLVGPDKARVIPLRAFRAQSCAHSPTNRPRANDRSLYPGSKEQRRRAPAAKTQPVAAMHVLAETTAEPATSPKQHAALDPNRPDEHAVLVPQPSPPGTASVPAARPGSSREKRVRQSPDILAKV